MTRGSTIAMALCTTTLAVACGGGSARSPDAAPAADAAPAVDAPPPVAPVFTAAPTVTPNELVPLAPRLRFTTDLPTRASIEIADGNRTFTVTFDTPTTVHDHVLLQAFRAGRSHQITATATTAAGGTATATPLTLVTPALPVGFPKLELTVSDPTAIEGGVTVMSAFPRGPGLASGPSTNYLIAVDASGDVVWYYGDSDYIGDARRSSRGTILYGDREMAVVEIDMAGTTLRRWHAANLHATPRGDIAVAVDSMHHENFEMASGDLLVLSSEQRHFNAWPSSETNLAAPPAPAEVVGDVVAQFRTDGTVVGTWKMLDLLDPQRIGYNSTNGFWNLHYGPGVVTRDWSHGNAVVHDPTDDSIIVSLRHQDAVVKLRRSTGELVWILGPHENWKAPWSAKLLAPVGPFTWQYHQHASKVLANGNLMLYDNGTFRASPPDAKVPAPENYSRAVELVIDEKAMTVTQVWSYGGPGSEIFYSPFICDAEQLPRTGNVMITDGGRIFDDGGLASDDLTNANRFARIVEVTHTTPPRKVWELIVGDRAPQPVGWLVYRSMRVPSLYP